MGCQEEGHHYTHEKGDYNSENEQGGEHLFERRNRLFTRVLTRSSKNFRHLAQDAAKTMPLLRSILRLLTTIAVPTPNEAMRQFALDRQVLFSRAAIIP